LTNENDNLCGYWELDPASLPEVLVVRKTKWNFSELIEESGTMKSEGMILNRAV
jgi:hypothetical protein